MNDADNIKDQRDKSALQVIELNAPAVAETPVLGYQMGEFPPVGADPGRRVRVPQPWIVALASPVKIDVAVFEELTPFDEILGVGATTSTRVSSVGSEMTEHWSIADEVPDELRSATPVAGVSVEGGGLRALVWSNGLIIGTVDPMAKALKLLIAGFSVQARHDLAYANRESLQSALDVFPRDVVKLYVPDAEAYLQQASQELIDQSRRIAEERQRRLKRMHRWQVRIVNGETITTELNAPSHE